jgi:hypothetical protein
MQRVWHPVVAEKRPYYPALVINRLAAPLLADRPEARHRRRRAAEFRIPDDVHDTESLPASVRQAE